MAFRDDQSFLPRGAPGEQSLAARQGAGMNRVWLGALFVSGVTVAVVVVAVIITSSGGDNATVASTDAADRKPVRSSSRARTTPLSPPLMEASRARARSGPAARSRTAGRHAVTGGRRVTRLAGG